MLREIVKFMIEQPKAMDTLFFWLRDDLRARVDIALTLELLVRKTIELVQHSYPDASPMLLASLEEITLRHFAVHEDYEALHRNVFQTGIRFNTLAPEVSKFALSQSLFCEISYDSFGALVPASPTLAERDADQNFINTYCQSLEIAPGGTPRFSDRGIILPVHMYIIPRADWLKTIFREAELMHRESPDFDIVFDALPDDIEDSGKLIYAPHVISFLNTKANFWQQRIWEMALQSLPLQSLRELLWSESEQLKLPKEVRAHCDEASVSAPDRRLISRAIDGVLLDVSRRLNGPLGIGFTLVSVRNRETLEIGTYVLSQGESSLSRPELAADLGYEAVGYKISKKIKIIGKDSEEGGGIFLLPRLLKRSKREDSDSEELLLELFEQRYADELSKL